MFLVFKMTCDKASFIRERRLRDALGTRESCCGRRTRGSFQRPSLALLDRALPERRQPRLDPAVYAVLPRCSVGNHAAKEEQSVKCSSWTLHALRVCERSRARRRGSRVRRCLVLEQRHE